MAAAPTTVDEAKDLLSLIPFVWGILTVALLGPAWRWSSENEKYHVGRSVAALLMSLLAAIGGAIVVLVLAPIGYEAVFRNTGAIEGVLVLYELFLLAVVGATAWSMVIVVKAVRHLRLVVRG